MLTIHPEPGGSFAVYLGSLLIFGGLNLRQAFNIAEIRVYEVAQ